MFRPVITAIIRWCWNNMKGWTEVEGTATDLVSIWYLLVRYTERVYWWDISNVFIGEIYRTCLLVRYVEYVFWWDVPITFTGDICRSRLWSIIFISELCRGGQSNYPPGSPPPCWRKSQRYLLNRRLSKHQDNLKNTKISRSHWDSNPSPSSQQHSHFTNYATFSMAQEALVGQDPLIIEVSRSHINTAHGTTPLDKRSTRPRDLHLTTHNRQTSHTADGIRTRNPSKPFMKPQQPQ